MSILPWVWTVMRRLCVGSVAGLCALWLIFNSVDDLQWLRSPESIARSFSEEFGPGTRETEIRRTLELRGAELDGSSRTSGCSGPNGEEIGSGHLRYGVGHYWGFLARVDVSVTFCLDDRGRVLEVLAPKDRDSV